VSFVHLSGNVLYQHKNMIFKETKWSPCVMAPSVDKFKFKLKFWDERFAKSTRFL
jgi:hypothetical protein